MRVLRLLYRESRPRLATAIVSGAVSGACAGAIVAKTQRVSSGVLPATFGVIASFAVLVVVQVIARMTSQSELLELVQLRLLPNMRRRMTHTIVEAPQRVLDALGPGRLLGAVTSDVFAISQGCIAWMMVAHSGVAVVMTTISIASLSVEVFAAVVGSVVLSLLVHYLLFTFAQRYVRRAQTARGAVHHQVNALTSGLKELLLDTRKRDAFVGEAISPAVHRYHSLSTKAAAWNDVVTAWAGLIMFVLIGLLLFVWPRVLVVPQSIVLSCAIAILYVQAELSAILQWTTEISRAEAAVASQDELGAELRRERAETPDETSAAPTDWESIELAGVIHRYRGDEGEEFSLGPIDLTVRRGETLFIVGGNGSGKSTLAKVLVGLYPPDAGDLRLDGANQRDALDRYRAHFSAVFTDSWLFDRLYGIDPAIIEAEATALLARLGLSKKVRIENGAFSTIQLSTGQKKRLALVTALLESRPICVLDEWAAEQDPSFKEEFYLRLLPEMKARGITPIVITHDDRYLRVADRVIRLREGKIVSDTSQAVDAA